MLQHALLKYGYLILFGGTMVEGDGVLLTAAFLAHRGYLNILFVILVAALANATADLFYYAIARRRGREFFARRAASDPRFAKVNAWIEDRGPMLLFASRFMWGFRIAIPAACGAAGMRRRTFVAVNAAGSITWALAFGIAGYALGNSLSVLLADVRRFEWYVAGAVLLAVLVVGLSRRGDLRREVAILRRPAQAVTDLSVMMFGLAHRASRLMVMYPEARIAAFVVALGFVGMLTALFQWRFVHVQAVEAWLPLEVSRGSRALMMLNGIGLIVIGRGLARRKKVAWGLAVVATALSAALHLGHAAAIGRAALSALLLAELVRQRHKFSARSDPVRFRHAIVAAPVLAIGFTVFGAVSLHQLTREPVLHAAGQAWQVAVLQDPSAEPHGRHARALVDSLRLLALASAAYLVLALLAPVALRGEPATEAERVHDLAWNYGLDSLSYFAKQADKRHLVAGDAFIGFGVAHRVAVAAGDPVGRPDAIPGAIARFVELCRTNDWIPVFYEVSPRHLEDYKRAGLQSFKVGEEAVVQLASFTLQGSRIANVRHTITKTKKEAPDLSVVEYRREVPDPEIDEQLEEISDEWLAGKRGVEMGFNLGVFSVEELADKRTMLAMGANGRVYAFLTWLPYRGGRAVVLDAMRRRTSAPYGVIDFLIAESALLFKNEGLEALSLATAPLANIDETLQSPYDRGVRLVFEHFSSFYGYRSLFNFKKKFNPQWEGRYLVFPRADLLPRIAYALVAVHTEGGVLRLLLNR